jgi:hypothetical protein
MEYGYAPQNVAPSNQITRRPLTQAEAEAGIKFFKSAQMLIRVVAFIPLIIIVINVLLLGSDYIVSIIALVFSVVVIIVSIAFIVMGRKVSAAVKTGMAIEIRAPAYKASPKRNMPVYSVGPIMLMATPEVERLIVQGDETVVVCIPQVKVALSVNNTPLARVAAITCSSNIEAMAHPTGPQHQQFPTQNQPPGPP